VSPFHPLWPWPQLHPHLVFEVLAWLAGLAVTLAQRRTPDPAAGDVRRAAAIAALIGAALGSKVLHWLTDPQALLAHLTDPVWLLGGKTMVGGLLGGWLAVELTKRWMGVTTSTGDRFVPGLSVGLAVGRLGCFFSGLSDGTHGAPTALPWGMDLGDGVARHPVTLYEAAVALLLLAIPAGPRSGDRFRRWVAAYLGWRLLTEPLKPQPVVLAGLTTLQLACLLGLAALVWTRRAPD
jgi:phosphatidylglycerol:prolipoprotein diacylglycerol transferase